MCFAPTARPPAPPRTGFLGGRERLTLRSDAALAGTLAKTTRDRAPGVVILADGRAPHPYYEALAEAFADAGVHALAIDRAAATDAGVRADVGAAADELRRRGVATVFVLGFCSGGRAAFLAGTQDGIAGAAGFDGWPTRREESGSSPVDEARAGRFKAPVLAIYGGADEQIAPEDQEAFARALTDGGVLHETVVYDDAPQGFFDRSLDAHAEACADAWRVTLRFFGVPVLG